MKLLYIATSKQIRRTRQFKQMIRLVQKKCTRELKIKLFKDKFASISLDSEPIGTLVRIRNNSEVGRMILKFRQSKRLTISQLERWKKKEDAINEAVLAEWKAAADQSFGSIH